MDVGHPHIQDTYHSSRGLQEKQGDDKRSQCKTFPYDQSRRSDSGTKATYHLFLKVLDLTERRMGAKLVPDYLENVTTPDQYEILEMNRISGFVDRARGLGRPTKKDRRELEQFTDLGMMNDGFDFEFDFEDPEDEE